MSSPKIVPSDSVHRGRENASHEQIKQQQSIASLAYALWQRRGCPQGSPEEDWIEAERQLQGVSERAVSGGR